MAVKTIIKYNGNIISDVTGAADKTLSTTGKLLEGPIEVITTESLLPTGYTQLEYIESTQDGGQFINVDANMQFGYTYETKFSFNYFGSDDQAIFGNLTTSNGCYCGLYRSEAFFSRVGDTDGAIISSTTAAINTKYKFTFQLISGNSICTIKNGDTVVCTINNSSTLAPSSYKCRLFTENFNDGTTVSRAAFGKCYSFKIVDSSLNYIRNMIPAKRNSDLVIGMYDIANSIFYANAGSGTFIAGPEV